MKKIIALVMAAIMLLVCYSFAAAEETPEGYPEVIEGLDFGGQTVYIYDWWTQDDVDHSTRVAEYSREIARRYGYTKKQVAYTGFPRLDLWHEIHINKKQKNISVMQTSESFLLSALLSFSGGLQDAYTFNLRDNVFANAQTGNVVLMSQNFMTGKYMTGLRYICPLIAFVLGIFIADVVENKYKHSKKLHWRQMILVMEMISLSIVGMIPFSMNMVANMIVSFSCAMQVQTFRTVRGYGYASTMCIGNLRSGTVSL